MKSAGVVRKIDNLGRLTIPKELREVFDLPLGTPMEFFVDDKGIYIRKFEISCTFCGEGENLYPYHDKYICKKCIENLTDK